MNILKGNAIVGQSGGPTAAINATLSGVIRGALAHSDIIGKIYGMKNGIEGFLCLLLMFAVLGVCMFWDKRIAMATKATFYEKKVVYNFDFLFIHIEKVVKYADIKDVTYFQKIRQKKHGFGDLCFYARGPIPGTTLLNGFQIKNVEDVEGTLEKIGEIVRPFIQDKE